MTSFALLDWAVLIGYLAFVVLFGLLFSRRGASNTAEFFLGGNSISIWLVTVSVLATTQSAATFLGGPDYGYRGDYTYLGSFLGAIVAAVLVSKILIPRYYAIKATTVYDLLTEKYGVLATKAAGVMYLIGRIFANGARLYMAAIAVSMILFGNIAAVNVSLASALIVAIGFGFTFVGGIRSVIWSDLIQFIVYVGAAIWILLFLYGQIPASFDEIYAALQADLDGNNKLQVLDFRLDFTNPFSIYAVFTGVLLVYVANLGLDQDTTQRLLTCKDEKQSARALIISAVAAIPVIWIFVTIGQLLFVFYQRPDLMQITSDTAVQSKFSGQSITIFMSYILSEIPVGLKGLVTAGVVAAALSTLNSGLNSMSSVLIKDFYQPWKERRKNVEPKHFVVAGRIGMAVFAIGLFAMSILCYFWQKYSDTPLLEFAWSVMTFAYAGLLGVFSVAVFTDRGSAYSVIAALIIGFIVVLAQQNFIVDALHLPSFFKAVAFPWKLSIAVLISAAVCALGKTQSV